MRKESLLLQDKIIVERYMSHLSDEEIILKYQDKVIELNDPGLAIFFAEFIPESDSYRLNQIVIDSNDPYLNIYYPLFVDNSRLLENGKVIMESNDPILNYCFPILIDGADKIGHGEAINRSDSDYYKMAYARDVYNNSELLDNISDDDIKKKSKLLVKLNNMKGGN